ncbi:type I-G CRISPR-associated protein, Cas3-extension family [Methylacidiphilum caldifontis]|uniref:Type I-U CRISPR-associated protein Csx17 n=1 Tax=Methylacidiphilum caldifontis TaxID=2795386 RepID=A0A4Y8PGQ4_9BACT|nr:hypothetical protein [Methylacidiphilum caldifontis]TFE70831.1 hypothetical protein A7Q10_00390 [Methylacidiphilum caldifontis]
MREALRLEGLEPDNLLAFLALLGLLRALEEADGSFLPRAAWDVDIHPMRPKLFLSRPVEPESIAEAVDKGMMALSKAYYFDGRKDLNYSRDDCRMLLKQECQKADLGTRWRVDLLASLMSDAAIEKNGIDPTPLCLLTGQGHQHFLERLAKVPNFSEAHASPIQCIIETLFHPWHRRNQTPAFRWDPQEERRYALLYGDPSKTNTTTQHGANRLAAVGIGTLTLVPQLRSNSVRANILGGSLEKGEFSFAWPIWREPATLSAIRSMLAHSGLRKESGLSHLGVDYVMVARRIQYGYYSNFVRAVPLHRLGS